MAAVDYRELVVSLSVAVKVASLALVKYSQGKVSSESIDRIRSLAS
jgi:hypothetical protein